MEAMRASVPVDSSALDAVGYDPRRRVLHVAYKGGREYAYLDVPPDVYDALLQADSKGRFVNEVVKPRYRFEER